MPQRASEESPERWTAQKRILPISGVRVLTRDDIERDVRLTGARTKAVHRIVEYPRVALINVALQYQFGR